MSEIRVNTFKAEDGISAPSFPNGLQVTGVVTATVLDSTVPFLNAGSNIQLGNAGIVTATSFVGNLTGNPTGTLQTAAQPNITSVGTLSSLNVSGNSGYSSFRLLRGSTSILLGDTDGNRERSTFGTYVSASNLHNVSGTILDSPSTTSAVTYKMQAYNPYSSSYLTAVNYQQSDGNYSYINVVPSVLTVMEVSS